MGKKSFYGHEILFTPSTFDKVDTILYNDYTRTSDFWLINLNWYYKEAYWRLDLANQWLLIGLDI